MGKVKSPVPVHAGLPAHRVADEIARHSYGKLVAFLAARTRNIASAEDALSDAFAAALTDWPVNGCPANPEAWLLTVARRKSVDGARRQNISNLATTELQMSSDPFASPDICDMEIPDQRLALMFACAHPAIDPSMHAPLMLQTVVGLDAARIASAFLISPATMGKRLVRAKQKIRSAGIPFQIPARDELGARLERVLDAIYAAYSDGWNDPIGADSVTRAMGDEALFLGQVVVHLARDEPEALGLLALMLHTEARRAARRTHDGEFVPLDEQDPSRWDFALIDAAEQLLRRASELKKIGRYQLEAALQSAHVHRRRTGEPNWLDILRLYDALSALAPSPVVSINRALAIAQIHGAHAALEELPNANDDARLIQYQPYWTARATLLAKTGAIDEATHAFDIAIGLESDPAVRKFLQQSKTKLRR